MMIKFIELVIKCLFAHAIGDFALQSDSMAKGKNRHNFDLSKVPRGQKPINCWFFWMGAHALTNGAMYYVFIENVWIALLETLLHVVIDIIKCENRTNPLQDQAFHFSLIILYVLLLGM